MRTPDTAHLTPADAELLAALYRERNGFARAELNRAERAAQAAAGRRLRRELEELKASHHLPRLVEHVDEHPAPTTARRHRQERTA